MKIKILWSFCILASIVAFVLTDHYMAAFLFLFLFPREGKSPALSQPSATEKGEGA